MNTLGILAVVYNYVRNLTNKHEMQQKKPRHKIHNVGNNTSSEKLSELFLDKINRKLNSNFTEEK